MSLLENIAVFRGGLSINKLEKLAGLTRGSMAKWDNHAPSFDKLQRVADVLGVTVEELQTGIKKAPPADGGREELFSIFDSLDPARQAALLADARALAAALKSQDDPQ